MKKNFILLLVICGLLLGFSARVTPQALPENMQETVEYAKSQLEKSIPTFYFDQYPRRNYEGQFWYTTNLYDWTSGFWPGCLWKMYELTNDSVWLENAREWTGNLEMAKTFTWTHDIGFQIMSSFGNGYRLAPLSNYDDIIIEAAHSLATRWNANAGSIISWDKAPWHPFNHPVIIDNIMTLELLFYATRLSGDSTFHKMAVAHVEKTLATHSRPNGTFYHIVDYNDSGRVVFKGLNMGVPLDPEESWARGQGWGLYGFVMSYRYTHNFRFLSAARKLADYITDSIPEDYVPYFMFRPMNNNMNKDASSAAIMLSALLELYEVTGSNKYLELAGHIFESLSAAPYITKNKAYYSILNRCTENFADVEKGMVYADYYFLEAMTRYKRLFPGSSQPIIERAIRVILSGIYMPEACIGDLEVISMTGVIVYRADQLYFSKGYNYLPLRDYINGRGLYIVRVRTDKGDVMFGKIWIP